MKQTAKYHQKCENLQLVRVELILLLILLIIAVFCLI